MAILMILSILLLYISFHTSSAFFHKISLLSYKIKEQTRTSTTSHKMSSLILNNNEPDDDNNKLEEAEDAFGAAIGPLPTVSSKINFGDQTPKNIKHDLWIVGGGTLGSLAAQQWKQKYPQAIVHAETRTDSRHSFFAGINVSTSLRSARSVEDELSARNVLIALPPSSAVNYVDELNAACRLWAGALGNGSLVFTSSIGVYGESFGNIVNETFRVDTRTQRTSLMLAAEEAVLVRKGAVVRLAGLYLKDRGPHTFWLKNGTVDAAATGCINMLHYEDAAGVAVAALEKASPGEVYLASDDFPLTRRELCQAALNSGLFPTSTMPVFTSETSLQSKICDDSYTRTVLAWSPRYKNFGEYMTTTIGGKPYTLEPNINGKARPSARALVELAKKKEEKKSALWLPGDEDDLL